MIAIGGDAMKQERRVLTIRLPEMLKSQLDLIADAQVKSLNQIVREAIEEYLEKRSDFPGNRRESSLSPSIPTGMGGSNRLS